MRGESLPRADTSGGLVKQSILTCLFSLFPVVAPYSFFRSPLAAPQRLVRRLPTSPRRTPLAASAEAYYQFLLGRHLEGDGQIDKAVAAYQRAAALDPASSAIPAELAGLYARQGRIKDATGAADAALKLNPADVDAHRVLGSIYASLAEPDEAGKTPADSAENVRKAVEHLEKAHRADGTDRDAGLDLALARLYIQSDQDQKAADLLRRVIEYEPDAGEVYVLLAHVETSLGHAERATDALEAGAAGNPRLLQTLAGLYETQENWNKAAATYERLSGFNPGSVEVKTKWAAALLQAGDDKQATKARDLLVEANRAAPTEARPLYLLSVAERKRRDYSAAETAAKRLVALDPDGFERGLRACAGVRGSAPL